MKKVLISLVLILAFIVGYAQDSNNEWLKTNQDYIKIPVTETGVHKVSIGEIVKIYPKILQAQISQLEIIFQGKSITFEYQSSDDKIDIGDWIYFYGIKNDGTLESELYRPASAQAHKLYSLFTDKSIYYLSINTSQSNYKKIQTETVQNPTSLNNVSSQYYSNTQVFFSDFSFNSVTGPIPLIQNSFFEAAENYTGPMIRSNTNFNITSDIEGIIDPNINLEIMLNGRDSNLRRIKISTANIDTTVALAGFSNRKVRLRPKIKNLNETKLDINIISADDRFSVNYVKTSFSKSILLNKDAGDLIINNALNSKLLVLNTPNKKYRIFNISNPYLVTEAKQEINSDNFILNSSISNNTYHYFSDAKIISDLSVLKPENNSFNNTANYLIISNKKLKESSKEYANFRKSKEGGNYEVELVFVEDLDDQFNFGIKSPLSIKNYLRFKLKNGKPTYLLLIGKALSAYTGKDDSTDLVPSIGYPASDALLSAGINTHEDVPALATGRIPALSNKEVRIYLDKLKQNLALTPDIHRKNVIHLNGGKTFAEIANFGTHIDSYKDLVEDSDFGVNFYSQRKQSLDPKEPANIVSKLNEGVSLISFLGHSSYQTIDLNIGYASDPLLGYQNKRFPVLFFNGCAFNNYFREIPTLSHDWIFAENKGAIAIIGQSYYGYLNALDKHAGNFYKNIFKSESEPSIGEALKLTTQQVVDEKGYSVVDVINNNQTLLFGDPAIKIFGYDKPDFSAEDIQLLNIPNSKQKSLKFAMINTGKLSTSSTLKLQIIQEGILDSKSEIIEIYTPNLLDSIMIPITPIELLNKLKINIDPNNEIIEDNKSNNQIELALTEILGKNLGDFEKPILLAKIENKEPYENMIVSNKPELHIILKDNKALKLVENHNKNIVVYLKQCEECTFEKLDLKLLNLTKNSGDSTLIDIKFSLTDLKPGQYSILIVGIDDSGNSNKDKPVQINFVINEPDLRLENELLVYPNPSKSCLNFEMAEFNSSENGTINYGIYTIDGKLLESWTEKLSPGKNTSRWCTNQKGTFVYKVKTNSSQLKNSKLLSGKVIITD